MVKAFGLVFVGRYQVVYVVIGMRMCRWGRRCSERLALRRGYGRHVCGCLRHARKTLGDGTLEWDL